MTWIVACILDGKRVVTGYTTKKEAEYHMRHEQHDEHKSIKMWKLTRGKKTA